MYQVADTHKPIQMRYLKAEGNYTRDVTTKEKILCLRTMKEALDDLDGNFLQIHRSYAVALDKVEKIENHQLTVAGNPIPIGISFRKMVQDLLL